MLARVHRVHAHPTLDKRFDFRRDGVPDRIDATTVDGNVSLYSTHFFRDEAISLIQAHAEAHAPATAEAKPFFLYLPFQAVHSPLQATKHWLNMQQPLSSFGNSTDRWTYAAMVANMDFAVGKVVSSYNEHWLFSQRALLTL
jgi:arylsulfatase A-like enzyme